MLLRTLGGLELEGAEFRRPKPLLLLAYLALEGPQERGHLAELFFRGSKKARANLSVALSRLRQAAPELVGSDNTNVWSEVETDAGCLITAIDKGEFEEAVNLYRGRFLNGFNTSDLGPELEEWVYRKREHIASKVRYALLALAEQVAVPGQFDEAAKYAEQAYLVSGAPEPEPQDLTRLYALLTAAGHPQATDVKAEAQAYGLTLTLEPEEAQEQLLEARPADWLPANPYKGLAYFREEDSELFFGREHAVSELLSRVQQQPLVAVIGSSGSGKSSLVFAGLVPKLREAGWLIAAFRPGLQPFASLAAVLLELLEPNLGEIEKLQEAKKLAAHLRTGELLLKDLLERLRQKHPESKLLLVIDQFEELYTFSERGGDGFDLHGFLDQLLDAAEHQHDVCKLVLTLRADFMAAALEYRPMVDLLQRSEYLLGPMNESELREVIEKPALKRSVRLEDGLVARILHDVTGREGSLPLLAFALSELWQQQEHGKLTHHAYDAIGGIERALANHAEAVFSGLSEDEQEAAQRVFLQLVYPGAGQEDTRRVATAREVGEHWSLVSKLASARLVVTGQSESGEQTAEVVHEALIKHWGRLRRWMDEYRSFRTWQEHLRQDVRRWDEQRDEGFLLRGFPLEEARQQLKENGDKLNHDERAFIEASLALEARENAERERRRHERARLQRRVTQVLSAALVVALALTGVAAWQWRTASQRSAQLAEREEALELSLVETETQKALAVQERDEAERQRLLATFRGLEGQALAAIQNDAYSLASLLSAQGLKMTADNTEDRRNFISVMLGIPAQLQATFVAEHGVEHVTFSPDGKLLADTSGRIWDVESKSELGRLPDWSEHVAFSPDGQIIATTHETSVKLWDAETLSLIGEPLLGHKNIVKSVAFSPDGKLLASGDQKLTTIVWDVERQTMVGEPLISAIDNDNADPGWVNELTFSPDGRLIASGDRCCVVLWDLETRTQFGPLGDVLQGSTDSIAYSPDGKMFASGGWDETLILWDMENQTMIGEPLTQHGDAVMGVAFSPDGKTLVSGSYDKTLILWDVESLQPIGEPLRGHENGIRSVAFSPDGKTVASSSIDGKVLLWDVSSTQRLSEPLIPRNVGDIAFSPDGTTFASGGWGGIRVWDTERQTRVGEIELDDNNWINSLAYSPDGKMLASNYWGSPFSARLWNMESFEQVGDPFIFIWENVETQPWSVALSPDGKLLASGSVDEVGGEIIVLWDVATHAPIGEPLAHEGRIDSLVFNPDGSVLASASTDGTVRLWDVETQDLVGVLSDHRVSSNGLAFSPDGSILASGGEDELIILWDVESQEILGSVMNSPSIVYDVAFSPDGNVLATATEQDGVLFWDVETQLPLSYPYTGHTDNSVEDIAFSPDGKYLVSGGVEEIFMWDAKPEPVDWFERACRIAGRNLTQEEWQTYLGDIPYEATCPQFPPG